jgi:hypothetical protein
MDKVTPIDSPEKRRRKPVVTSSRSIRDKSVELERMRKARSAYELVLAGKSHSEIAELLDLSGGDVVWTMMTEMFLKDARRLTAAERQEMLGTELLRLNALQAAVWPAAMMGDPKSVDSAVRIIQARARISGLEQVDPVVQKNLVLVMGEKEEDYIAALKAAGGDGED